ncbi:hypothetical protein BN381_70066 [Candidatus Microthrix parvicella RN1]|uniref:Uncharacterized protein n=1 Tax=Candidatus Neomicrothrix parvicella RN1 TaxID=1229780 RepID=R4Z7E5_9ACTN|nr:hypothetical protein BN381_70066 [Candidatus Microthrix parvicella RN1]
MVARVLTVRFDTQALENMGKTLNERGGMCLRLTLLNQGE